MMNAPASSAAQALAQALLNVSMKHELQQLRMDSLICRCGKWFPARVPEDWLPTTEDLPWLGDKPFTPEEWAVADEEEKQLIYEATHIKLKTMHADFRLHEANMLLAELAAVDFDPIDQRGWELLLVTRRYRLNRYDSDGKWMRVARPAGTHHELVHDINAAADDDNVAYTVAQYKDSVGYDGPWVECWDSRDVRPLA